VFKVPSSCFLLAEGSTKRYFSEEQFMLFLKEAPVSYTSDLWALPRKLTNAVFFQNFLTKLPCDSRNDRIVLDNDALRKASLKEKIRNCPGLPGVSVYSVIIGSIHGGTR
jgi:hypothetical protein